VAGAPGVLTGDGAERCGDHCAGLATPAAAINFCKIMWTVLGEWPAPCMNCAPVAGRQGQWRHVAEGGHLQAGRKPVCLPAMPRCGLEAA
jgi:hypothetical protein